MKKPYSNLILISFTGTSNRFFVCKQFSPIVIEVEAGSRIAAAVPSGCSVCPTDSDNLPKP
ncbi:MAG TPA: hypothetical protein VK174_12125 [Chitinophagales bacterium]|nr:hypothetical protein [Chitinophagales bacterium]